MTNIILAVLAVVWLVLMIGGWGFMIYKDIRDDIRNERERKAKLKKNKGIMIAEAVAICYRFFAVEEVIWK